MSYGGVRTEEAKESGDRAGKSLARDQIDSGRAKIDDRKRDGRFADTDEPNIIRGID